MCVKCKEKEACLPNPDCKPETWAIMPKAWCSTCSGREFKDFLQKELKIIPGDAFN